MDYRMPSAEVTALYDRIDEATLPLRWESFGRGTWRRGGVEATNGCCPDCGDNLGEHGYATSRPRCRCSAENIERVTAEIIREHGAPAVAAQWLRSSIPARYRSASFESFTAREGTQLALARAERWANEYKPRSPHGLYLAGPFGSGKTHLVVAILRRILERTMRLGSFMSAPTLIRMVKSGGEIDMRPANALRSEELVVIDDIGQIGRTEFDREILYGVFNDRYEANRPTIFTSNRPPDGLTETLGGAFVSRIYECCEVIVLTASDYRRTGR